MIKQSYKDDVVKTYEHVKDTYEEQEKQQSSYDFLFLCIKVTINVNIFMY